MDLAEKYVLPDKLQGQHKGQSYLHSELLNGLGSSVVVTDLKGELLNRNGYQVKKFDLNSLDTVSFFNPYSIVLGEIKEEYGVSEVVVNKS